MAKILKFPNVRNDGFEFPDQGIPLSVLHRAERTRPSKLKLSTGRLVESACINCKELYCVEMTEPQAILKPLEQIQRRRICPTGAISLQQGILSINMESCVKCGLCIARCPIGAIYLDGENYPVISIPGEEWNPVPELTELSKLGIRCITESPFENETVIRYLIENIGSFDYNKLVATALNLVGIPTNLTRAGDVNLRMDALARVNDTYFVVEAEPSSTDTLNVPRGILDGVAVLSSRYNLNKENIRGIAVFSQVPNKRSDYWELLKDIQDILNVTISTIPLAVLLVAAWNGLSVDLDRFTLKDGELKAEAALEDLLERNTKLAGSGLLDPIK